MQTEMFFVNASRWRVWYLPGQDDGTMLQVAAYDGEGALLDMITNQTNTPLLQGMRTRTDRGYRYLAVNSMDTDWTVIVQQHLSAIDEWHLIQLMKQETKDLVKLGTWTGEAADETYTFHVPRGSWKLAHSHTGDGLLQIVIANDEHHVALAANADKPGNSQSWIHRNGTFRMEIKATDVQWRVDVFGERQAHGEQTQLRILPVAPVEEPAP